MPFALLDWLIKSVKLLQSEVEVDDTPDKYDIRNSVPGTPGEDYPVHGFIPKTSFECGGKTPGFYSDPETRKWPCH